MRLSTFLKPFSFLPAIMLMYMIYSFSAQEADISSQVSFGVSRQIVKTADSILDLNLDSWQIDDYAYRLEGRVRKFGHMGEYFLLAIAVSFPLYVYGLRGILLMLLAGAFCVFYAVSDEYHQTMVLGRSGSARDVMIDSIGIFAGVIFTRITGFIGRKTIFRPLSRSGRRSAGRQHARDRRIQQRELERIREQREREEYEQRKEARRLARERQKAASRNAGITGSGEQYDRRSPERQAADDRYQEERRAYDRSGGYEDDYPEGGYLDDEFDERDYRYERYDERYDDPRDFRDAYTDDDPGASSDDLSEDMPLSHLLHRSHRR